MRATTERTPAEILQAMLEMFETGDTTSVASVVSASYVDHQGVGQGEVIGGEGFASVVEVARRGLAALTVRVLDVVADDSRAAARLHWTATLESGLQVSRDTLEIVRVNDGLAIEHWGAGERWFIKPQESESSHEPQHSEVATSVPGEGADAHVALRSAGPDEIDPVLIPDDQPRLITFVFGLPVQLPLPHESTVGQHLPPGEISDSKWDFEAHMQMGESWSDRPLSMRTPFVSLKFWQPKVTMRYALGDAGIVNVVREIWGGPEVSEELERPSDTPVDSYRTVVEAVTQAALADGEAPAPNVVSACFNRCLAALNNVVDAYSTAFDDAEMPHFSASHLGLFAFAGSKPLASQYDVGPVMYLLPMAPPPHSGKRILEGDDWAKVMHFFGASIQGNPFIGGKRYFIQAMRALSAGDHAQALVLFATSGEISLNAVLRSVVVEREGVALARAIFEPNGRRTGLKARLRSEYQRRLGAGSRWNPEIAGSEVAKWWNAVQAVRGRVVHGGYHPTPQEAYNAMVATEDLDRFIDIRLADRRFDFPATVLSKLGALGLAQRGLWSKRMQGVTATTDVTGHWGRVRESVVGAAGDDEEET